MIDDSISYYLGSWRRCPFDASIMPQSLNVDDKSLSLRLCNFDSEFNNLWRFNGSFLILSNPSPAVRRHFPNADSIYVSTSLRLTEDPSEALAFFVQNFEPFRKGPLDVAMQIFASDGSVLVSNERTGRVLLAELSDAESRVDKSGNFVMNIAWEATPDTDDAVQGGLDDVPEWLHDILIG